MKGSPRLSVLVQETIHEGSWGQRGWRAAVVRGIHTRHPSVSKGGHGSVLCQIPTGIMAFVWLESGVSTEQELSLLQRGGGDHHTSQVHIRQYLFGIIGGNKPACPTSNP